MLITLKHLLCPSSDIIKESSDSFFIAGPLNCPITVQTNSMKTEFLCVKPKSKKAKNRFANEMDLLHSCRIEKRDDGKVFLSSISGRYFFWMNESADDHWEVIK